MQALWQGYTVPQIIEPRISPNSKRQSVCLENAGANEKAYNHQLQGPGVEAGPLVLLFLGRNLPALPLQEGTY